MTSPFCFAARPARTPQPIKSIAYQVGYPNALYFSTEFHRHTGESPTAFRRRRQYYD